MTITISELVSKLLAIPDQEQIIDVIETGRSFDGSVPDDLDIMITFSHDGNIEEINNIQL